MLGWRDCVDDDQLSSATWTRQREDTRWLIGIIDAAVIDVLPVWRFGSQQVSDLRDIDGTVAVSEEAIVTDAVLASGQDVDQEPADELICGQGHGGVAACAIDAVILDAEGDAVLIETDQSAVGYCHPVRVTRQISQHGFGSGEGFFGVDDPVDFAQGFEEIVEDGFVDEVHVIAEEMQFPGIMQLGQPFQNEPPVQARQHPDGQEEVLAAGDPF